MANKMSLLEVDNATHAFSVNLKSLAYEDVEITVCNTTSVREARDTAWGFIRQVLIEMDQTEFEKILEERQSRRRHG